MFEITAIETLLGRPVEPTELSDYPIGRLLKEVSELLLTVADRL
jgi:hypothetical protein